MSICRSLSILEWEGSGAMDTLVKAGMLGTSSRKRFPVVEEWLII